MEELIKKMIRGMSEVVATLPEKGFFEPKIVGFDYNDKDWQSKRFWLKVEQPPKGIEQYETMRMMHLLAEDEVTRCRILVAYATNQELLAKLAEDGFTDYLLNCAEKLEDHLLHPD